MSRWQTRSADTLVFCVASAVLFCAPIGAHADGPWFSPSTATLTDGVQLIVDQTSSAEASMRLIIDAGAKDDPNGRDGMAALLGHTVMMSVHSGTSADSLGTMQHRLRRLGASISVATGHATTTFALDAPASTFNEAAQALLLAISTPMLAEAHLRTASKISANRAFEAAGDDLGATLEVLAFPRRPGDLAGTMRLHDAIRMKELADFFQGYYRPDRITIIATGDVSMAGVRQIVDRTLLLPARLDDPRPKTVALPAPTLPVKATGRASPRQFVFGYGACGSGTAEAPLCYVLGELVRQQVSRELRTKLGVGADVDGGFIELPGRGFVALSINAGKWRGVVDRTASVFEGIAQRPRTSDVAQAIKGLAARGLWERSHPSRLADRYATFALAGRKTRAAVVELERAIRTASSIEVGTVARVHFVADKQVSIRLTPFGR